jgi:hypothetical protein
MRDRQIVMGILCPVSAVAVIAQLFTIDLNKMKEKLIKNTSFFITYIAMGSALISLYAFGPPFGPSGVTIATTLIMLCVRTTYPELILLLKEIMITGIFLSLPVEFFIVGFFLKKMIDTILICLIPGRTIRSVYGRIL